MRGLDYYNKTVFEWVTTELETLKGTVCAGGRYDGLVEQLGGKATPALGFAFGLERVLLMVQQLAQKPIINEDTLYFITENEAALMQAFQLAHNVRNAVPNLRVLLHCGGGSLKNQFKKADKSGAQIALILGEQELNEKTITIKMLRENVPQERISQDDLVQYLQKLSG